MVTAMPSGAVPPEVRARRGAAILRHLPTDLKNFRNSLDLSQTEVGQECKLSKSTIWRIESGRDVRMFCLLAVLDWMASRDQGRPQ